MKSKICGITNLHDANHGAKIAGITEAHRHNDTSRHDAAFGTKHVGTGHDGQHVPRPLTPGEAFHQTQTTLNKMILTMILQPQSIFQKLFKQETLRRKRRKRK